MTGFVKHVFTFLLWVTIAWIAYLVFFGTYSLDGRSLVDGSTAYTGNTEQTSEWKGVLWHAAVSSENPISKYYYEYCFLPNVHAGDYVDAALGGTARYALFETITDLEGDSDMYSVPSDYSTGWR